MTSSRRIKPREAALMFAPVLVLLVVGWFLRDKRSTYTPLRTSGPLQTVVTDIKLVPLKPMEVAEGFDTKVEISLALEGGAPAKKIGEPGIAPGLKNVRLTGLLSKPNHVLKDDEVAVEIGKHRWKLNQQLGVRDVNKVTLCLPLAKWKRSSTPLVLKGDLVSDLSFETKTPRATRISGAGPMRPVPFQFVVRAANQVVTPPHFSRDTKMTIESPRKYYRRSSERFNGKTIPIMYVTVPLRYEPSWLGNSKPTMHISQPYLVDERGHRYTELRWGRSLEPIRFGSPSFNDTDNKVTTIFEVPVDQIPLSAGQLTLKAYISCNDNWPVAISTVVRTKAESLPPKPSPFTVAKVIVGSPEYNRKDTQVELWLRFKGKQLLGEGDNSRVITDWSQHLVDAKGKEYTEFPTAPDEFTGIGCSPPIFDAKTRLYRVAYSFPLKTVPRTAGRLIFKAEIGLRGYKFLPVSVVVRP
jgi:hypothetical protein